jgi:hypothetical protein
MQKSPLKAL